MTYIEEYYNKISSGEIVACKKIKTVYKKLVDDLKKPKTVSFFNKITEENEEHTYIFDEEKANRPIQYIEKYCKHSKGKWAKKPVILELWQKAHIQALYGFVDKETGLRKYRKFALFVGKKNGKSTEGSGLGLYHLTKDGEGGAEVYSVATKKDQAKIIWEEAKRMAAKSPVICKRTRRLVNGIFYDKTESVFKAVASETDSLDGLNGSAILADEIWAWRDKGLLDIMSDSVSAREQPIIFEFSTMGKIREAVFDSEYEYFEAIIKGYEGLEGGIVDETVLPFIYELDEAKEWTDEKAWIKANPNLGITKTYKYLRDKVEKAKNRPDELSNLLCKEFNVRTTSQESWVSFDVANNEETFDMDEIYDSYAVGGVDLSSTTDLTCATLLVLKHNKKYVVQQYFIPSERLEFKIKDDKIPYDKWEKRGLVTICEGAKVNYSDVTQWFLRMNDEYKISTLWVGYDPWNTQYWVEEMKEYGFEMVEVRQGAKTMSNPMKQLEADLIEKSVNYNNNPVLKWCLCNTSVKRDDNDNIRPVKGQKQRARIDGAVSLIIAYCTLFNKMQDYLALQEE
ncbi:MAG TPA: terminase large subunit [Candidatus Tetragenococcus pullicola]|nr:terminase large subunit [Candidatus Tetragenococcus pullicola]